MACVTGLAHGEPNADVPARAARYAPITLRSSISSRWP